MNDEFLVEEIEYEGLSVKVHYDPEPMSPREWDNLGVMHCSHRRYLLGDEEANSEDYESWEDVIRTMKEDHGATVVLPLYLLDHSSLSISTNDYADPWDSGQVGWICDTTETRKLLGFEVDRFGRDEDFGQRIKDVLVGEVETYDQYLRGDIYGFVVEDEDGHHLDSCWGFYGTDDALNEGKSMAEWHAEQIAKAKAEANAHAIARTATLAWNGEDIDLIRGTA